MGLDDGIAKVVGSGDPMEKNIIVTNILKFSEKLLDDSIDILAGTTRDIFLYPWKLKHTALDTNEAIISHRLCYIRLVTASVIFARRRLVAGGQFRLSLESFLFS